MGLSGAEGDKAAHQVADLGMHKGIVVRL